MSIVFLTCFKKSLSASEYFIPNSAMDSSTGFKSFPFLVSSYFFRLAAPVKVMKPSSVSLINLSFRILVEMPSLELKNSLYVDFPRYSISLMISNDHLSPTKSIVHEIGQSERLATDCFTSFFIFANV